MVCHTDFAKSLPRIKCQCHWHPQFSLCGSSSRLFFLPLKFENWRNRIVAREKLCVREIAKTDVVAIFGQQQDILKLHQFILSFFGEKVSPT